MSTIRKLNIFLLVVSIICTISFAIKGAKTEKYSNYDEKIAVTFTDMQTTSNNKAIIYFTVTNNGKAEVSKMVLQIRVSTINLPGDYAPSKSFTEDLNCNFVKLPSRSSEKLQYTCYATSDTEWLLTTNKSKLKFEYCVKSVTFSDGEKYEAANTTFKGNTLTNNQNSGNQNDSGQSSGNQNDSGQSSSNQNQHTHNYNTLNYNETQHWYECSCGDKTNINNHSGGTATCTNRAVCAVCSQTYGNLADHTYSSNWVITENYHYQEATCGCEVKKDYGTHTVGDDGFCSLCKLPISATKGLIIDVSSDGTYAEVVGYSGSSTKINIPATYNNLPVKSIYKEVFKSKTTITNVVIPNSVTSIGNYAFYYCTKLASVTIGDSVTSIGDNAFYYCSNLKEVNYLGTVDQWAQIEFGDYDANPLCYAKQLKINGEVVTEVNLTTATKISSCAFNNCANITSVTIGNSVTSIGNNAFYNCSSLTNITFAEGSNVTSLSSSAFSGCNSALFSEDGYVKYIKANNNPYYIVCGLTNKNLSTYTINNTSKIIMPSVFSRCERLTNITIPNSVTSIGSYAFEYCTKLASVTIGDSVTSIGDNAFYYCSGLTSVVIGDSVTSIGDNAFYYCSGIKEVNYLGTIDEWAQIEFGDYDANPLYYAKQLKINGEVVTEVNLTTATKISSYAFYYCSGLTSVVIGDSVTSIGSSVFSGCSGLTSVVIGDSVTSIGSSAFSGCSGLTSVVIGDSVTSIGDNAFYYCSGLKMIYYTGTQEEWNSISKGSYWNYYTGGYTITYNYTGN